METLYSISFLDHAPAPIGPLYSVDAETASISGIYRFAIQNRAEFN